MRRELIILLILSVSYIPYVTGSDICDLKVNLINQDPYPAVPGDYVKLVFEVDGRNGKGCGRLNFELLDKYPIKFDPGKSGVRTFGPTNYIKDYNSNTTLIPYKVRVDNSALDGNNPIEVRYENENDGVITKTFDLEVQDVRADFEVYIKDYNYKTHELTLEIVNIGDSDATALTIEIPKQKNIQIKGAKKMVVGDLDSDDYTTAEFEAIPVDGKIDLIIEYSDEVNTRRSFKKSIVFDSSYFKDRAKYGEGVSGWAYAFWILVIILISWWFWKKRKNKA